MGLIAQAQQDAKAYSQVEDVTFSTPADVPLVVTLKAIPIRHNLVIDNQTGNVTNGINARVTVSELVLTALNYPVRNTDGYVDLLDHKVSWVDVSGASKDYIVREQYPDESTGLILCTLGLYES